MRTHYPRFALGAALAALAPAAHAQEARREAPPAPMPARPLAFPAFHETRLPNGMGLIVVENRTQPVANLYLVVRSGASSVPAAEAGTAELMAETITKGTATRTARQIAEAIEGTGGSLNAGATNDIVSVAATVLSESVPLAMELLSDVAMRPTFPDDEVQTARQRTLANLQAQLGQPAALANRQMLRQLYGAHPYGVSRTPQTVGALDAARLRAFHARAFAPANATLVVAGDVSRAQAEALARRHFGSWTGAAPARMSYPAVAPAARTAITLIHRPGSVQSSLRVGFPGVRPDNADYYPLLVLNKLLGGGTDARLFQILREQKGWTYGANTNVTRPMDVGQITAFAEVRTAVTDSATAEMMAQLRRVSREPVSAAELDAAKSFLTGSFPGSVETAAQVAAQVATTRMLGLPIDALLRFNQRIAAVTAADVQRVARTYITPERAHVVIVGDAAQVASKLERIAPVTVLDLQGNPVQRSALEVRASTERFDASRLRAGTHSYRVMAGPNPVGTQTVVLAPQGAGWTRTATVQFGPTTQTIVSSFGADLAPTTYTDRMTGPMAGEATVRLENGRVRGEMKMPPQAGGEKTYDLAAVPGTLFDGGDEAALMLSQLAPGKSLTLPVFNTRTGTIGNTTFRVTGAESVTVPAGTFPALRVEVSGRDRPMVMWVRAEAPHVPLRYEVTGTPLVVELTEAR